MEDEKPQLLALFDLFWFRHHVLLSSSLPTTPLPTHNPDLAAAAASAPEGSTAGEPPSPRRKSPQHCRSLSDEFAFASPSSSDSALPAHRPLKLETIFSGKASSEENPERPGAVVLYPGRTEEEAPNRGDRERKRWKQRERRRRRGGASQSGGEDKSKSKSKSKSLSELEFEELKGFMDLGFTFSEAESDQRLLSIVPGLQRLGRRRTPEEVGSASEEAEEEEEQRGVGGGGASDDEAGVHRPYLSEAWGVAELHEGRRSHAHDRLLRNWRVPAAGEGVDMKDHLRSWAHTVASAVR